MVDNEVPASVLVAEGFIKTGKAPLDESDSGSDLLSDPDRLPFVTFP